jgi:hypothetical protein
MSWTGQKARLPRSRWAVLAAVALFLVGINYCLVDGAAVALGHPAAPVCHAAPAPTPEGSCCHPGGTAARHPHAHVPGSPPCCLMYVAAPGVQLAGPDDTSSAPIDRVLLEGVDASFATSTWHGLRVANAQPPPISAHRSPARGRAPPLA